MAEFKWIIMSSFLMLVFRVSATIRASYPYTVRVGDEVTLPNVFDADQCEGTTWFFSSSGNRVTLFEDGQIHNESKAKSDRLSVTGKCSLGIKNVTYEDVGLYICRKVISGGQGWYDLSVVNMTEQKNSDEVKLKCSVLSPTHEWCEHTVRWLYEGNQNEVKTTQSVCSATVTFTASDHNQKSKYYELLKCEVSLDYIGIVDLFTFSPPQSSGDDATKMTTNTWTSEETSAASEINNHGTQQAWRFITVSVGLAALTLIVVTVNMWTRAKGNKTQTEENEGNDDDKDDATVIYENYGEPSVSVRLH